MQRNMFSWMNCSDDNIIDVIPTLHCIANAGPRGHPIEVAVSELSRPEKAGRTNWVISGNTFFRHADAGNMREKDARVDF